MSNDTQSAADTKRRRAIKEVGHWQMPLNGHGLAYFDELTVAYRTIPAHGTTDDPWARAAAKAVQDAQADAAACANAVKSADDAQAAAIKAPDDAKLKADADEKARVVLAAKAKRDESNKHAALLQGAVDSKVSAAAIIEGLLRKKELLDRKEPGGALWSDILIFESALLRMMWFEPLKAKLQSLRQEYRQAMGATDAQAMETTYLDLKSVTEDKDLLRLQAEAANLMAELHWSLVTAPAQEFQKTWLTIKLGGYALAVGALILLTCLRTHPSHAATFGERVLEVVLSLHLQCPTLSFVMLAGAAGATLSAFQRIQNGGASGAGLLNLRESEWGSLSIGVAPLIGATSALLLTLLFAGNIISGNFFPKVTLRAEPWGTNELASATTHAPPKETPGGLGVLKTSLPPVTVSNIVSLTNSYSTINHLTVTNALASTNATADPATWRDCKTFCQHRWCVAAGADLALLLIWAFIAGFSERLVPDMLSRLAKKAEEKV
ncbi:MAG: hypothetical protein ACYDH9_19120 [Limisphaerales bacterium]